MIHSMSSCWVSIRATVRANTWPCDTKRCIVKGCLSSTIEGGTHVTSAVLAIMVLMLDGV